MSGLTDNLVVAAVLGVLAVLLLFAAPLVGYMLPDLPLISFVGLLVLSALAAGLAYLATRSLTVTVITAALLVLPLSVLYMVKAELFAGLLPSLLEWISPFVHFESASSYGLFSIPAVILLLSYPVFFVFLTVLSADKKRWA